VSGPPRTGQVAAAAGVSLQTLRSNIAPGPARGTREVARRPPPVPGRDGHRAARHQGRQRLGFALDEVADQLAACTAAGAMVLRVASAEAVVP
jgi:hypothetical protein